MPPRSTGSATISFGLVSIPVRLEELEALEAAANPALDIPEFVPLAQVDPVYFETGAAVKTRPGEIDLARKLVAELSHEAFRPEPHHDHWRDRVEAAVPQTVAGEAVHAAPAPPDRAPVIDLMGALKQSLARGRGKAAAETAGKRRPAAAARSATAQPRRRVNRK